MWCKEIHHRLGLDMLPLRRRGNIFTWKTLAELQRRLVRATVYECGEDSDIAARVEALDLPSRPSLFDAEHAVRPLPQAHMLLEWTGDGEPRAALLTDRGDVVEAYIFRRDTSLGRWRWPLLGMAYGPTFNDSCRIAVHEPSVLQQCSRQARNAMTREHALAMRTVTGALELVRAGVLAPAGEAGPSALALGQKKKHKEILPTPPALARAQRVRHEGAVTGKGAHRM